MHRTQALIIAIWLTHLHCLRICRDSEHRNHFAFVFLLWLLDMDRFRFIVIRVCIMRNRNGQMRSTCFPTNLNIRFDCECDWVIENDEVFCGRTKNPKSKSLSRREWLTMPDHTAVDWRPAVSAMIKISMRSANEDIPLLTSLSSLFINYDEAIEFCGNLFS